MPQPALESQEEVNTVGGGVGGGGEKRGGGWEDKENYLLISNKTEVVLKFR